MHSLESIGNLKSRFTTSWVSNNRASFNIFLYVKIMVRSYGEKHSPNNWVLLCTGTCGGLLGLFMGFSCVSAIEVVYHLLLRPMFCFAIMRTRTTTVEPTKAPPTIAEKKKLQLFDGYYYN